MKNEKKNVYVLLVGINKYQDAPLKGATRTAIISSWEKHLGKAQKEDIVLFYFSGHGAQEAADTTIWKEEGNNKLEVLVCYDSPQTNLFLADKELRYLIHELAKKNPHIVTIFDCCHSGDNTRVYEEIEAIKKELYSKMSNHFPMRKWEDFYFHDKIDVDELKNTSVALNTTMPQGNHIQLSACQSDQSAYETTIKDWGRGGVFTYTLIDVLKRSKGVITYNDLKSRIFHYIKNRYKQSPTIYVKGKNNRELYKTFLGGAQHSQPLYGNLIYNKKRKAWILDLGAIHGISKQANTVTIKGNGQEVVGQIVKVHASDTEIAPSSDLPKGDYQAFIFPFRSAPIGVYLNGGPNEQSALEEFKDLIDKKGPNINLVSDERQADYTLQFGKEYYSITPPSDPYRPLVLPIKKTAENAAEITFDYLYHISQWEFIKLLHNTERNSQLNPDALKIEFFDKEKNLIPIQDDQVIRKLSKPDEQDAMRIRLTNTGNRTLHVAVLYLGGNFEANPSLLETKAQLLNKNDFVWLRLDSVDNNDNLIPYSLDKSKRIFNWKDNTTYLKFIISTATFDVDNLALNALPDPTALLEDGERDSIKGFTMRVSAKSEKWTTRLLTFTIPNPSYNKINIKDLKDKLQSAGASFFGGLYLEDRTNTEELIIKDEIEITS